MTTVDTGRVAGPPRLSHGSEADVALVEAIADRSRFRYRPALDGLRAVAVVGVLLYHGTLWWAGGGFLGVDVFFTLSGYLITTLLLLEHDATSRIDLRGFWIRRARRLLPALFAVAAAVIVYALVWADPVELNTLRGDAVASLLYVANWRFIFSHQSYFEQFAAPSPLRHTWSLAIEEQWYLIWPIVISVGYRLTKAKDRTWIIAITVAAALSALLMAMLYNPDTDPSRIYYGTDTRAQPLLIGAALAFILHNRSLARIPKLVLETLALAGLTGIFAMFYFVDDTTAWMYYGGFTLIAITTSLLIAVIVQPGPSIAQKLLSLPPLPVIGRASYGLYLWHWPIYVLLNTDRTGLDGDQLLWLRLTVTALVATASYNLIEMPIRHGALRRLATRLAPHHPGRLAVTATILTAIALIAILIPITNTPAQAAQQLPVQPGDTKVLLVGDSVVYGLNYSFTRDMAPGINLSSAAIIGCGILRAERRPSSHAPVKLAPDCVNRLDSWRQAVESYHPDLVLMLPGAYEVFDQAFDDKTYAFGTPEFAVYYRSELNLDLKVLTATGAKLVLLTSPCMKEVTPGGPSRANPERRDPSRTTWLNQQDRIFAASHPAKVELLDLGVYICPSNRFTGHLDGEKIYRDGVHFTPTGVGVVWRWLAPQLKRVAAR